MGRLNATLGGSESEIFPYDVEQQVRAKVQETARTRITAFIEQNPHYAPDSSTKPNEPVGRE